MSYVGAIITGLHHLATHHARFESKRHPSKERIKCRSFDSIEERFAQDDKLFGAKE